MRLRFVAAAAVLAAAVAPLGASPAMAEEPQETVVPQTLRTDSVSAAIRSTSTQNGHDSAGAQGVFHTMEGADGLLWTRYADGRSVPVPAAGTAPAPTGTDVLAYKYADGRVDFWDAADGSTSSLRIPDDLGYLTSYDRLTIAFRTVTREDGTTTRIVHLLSPGSDGTTRDLTVTGGPDGIRLGTAVGADAGMVWFRAQVAGELGVAAVDRATGEVRGWSGPLPTTYSRVVVGGGHVVVGALHTAEVLVFPRDLSSAPATVTLKSGTVQNVAVVGDWLVDGEYQVTAQPIAGGDPVTLLAYAGGGSAQGPDGSVVLIGRSATGERGIQRITPAADGGLPEIREVKPLGRPALKVRGLSLQAGRLVVTDYFGARTPGVFVRGVALSGTPEFGARTRFLDEGMQQCAATDVPCAQIHGTGDGRIAWLAHDGATDRIRVDGPVDDSLMVYGPGEDRLWERTGLPLGGRITDVSGRYLLYTGTDQQQVYRIGGDGTPVVTRTPGAAALSGDVLWTPGTAPGSVTAYSLTAGKVTATLTTDAGCAPSELQALGRWLYWACDGRAGVYDRTAQKSVPVPADEAKLGDGYVVTHDKRAGKLTLTKVVSGTPESRVIGDLPDTGVSQRDVRWTVDESGANAAYADDQERVHLVPSGVPQQPLRLLEPARNASAVQARDWSSKPDTLTTLMLSKPASPHLTIESRATGRFVDGYAGLTSKGELTVGWAGSDPSGGPFPSGLYDWTLSVSPVDGVGAPLTVRGTVELRNGRLVRHDHVGLSGRPDLIGDLLTLNSSGGLTFQQGTGGGTFDWKVTAGGWSTSTVAVPFGDLNGDSCNDVLVRMPDGSLRGYKVPCGKAPAPTMPYVKIGTGYGQYNVLTSPGDLTGDGRPDLLARKSSTGDIHLFAAKSDGTLAWPRTIRTAWTGYTHVVGAGDLTGDGRGDVLARDRAGTLWRYDGLGNGLLKDRVQVFTKWGNGYNAIVGAGDITGDGRDDLVERDSAGNLFCNAGNGRGSFGARVQIGTGWQGYKGLF
ncbi:FG-GAP repeat domain-containing protein [Streptomyces griseosporeus]|uniref:FG-GAP repeat domain-containing protein n=1 Tax=Streptomyces griseosporeus TaxID=1910 RepID=UPI00378F7A93